jgi:putative holliday junction resolvase
MSRSLGVDCGSKRVGLALSDPLGISATPVSVVDRSLAVSEIARMVAQRDVDTIVIGLPTGLGGEEGVAALGARQLGEELAKATAAKVVFHDERYTSRMAESALLESGMKRRDRRITVDKVAAAIILQDYLDATG